MGTERKPHQLSRRRDESHGDSTPRENHSSDSTRHDLPSILPRGVTRVLRRIPRRYRWAATVLASLALAALFVWSSLPDTTRHLLLAKGWDRVSSWAWTPNRVGYYPGVAVDYEEIVVDFAEWSAPRSTDDSVCCKTIWKHILKVRRLDEEARYVAKRVATTGGKPEITLASHDLFALLLVPGQRTSGPNMTRYDAVFDISREGLRRNFDLEFTTIRLGGFFDVQNERASLPIVQPTRRLVLKLQFTSEKPPKRANYSMSTRTERDNYTQLDDLTPPGKCSDASIEWAIDHPQLGYAYRVDWAW